jgi:phosphoglycerate dehydrogenase-like enzyme
MSPEDIPGSLLPRLESVVRPAWHPEGIDGLPPRHDAEVLVTSNAQLDAPALGRFPRLRAVVATGTAIDYIDLDHCRGRGITVCNTPGYTGSSVAEHALALALASNRHLLTLDAAGRNGRSDPLPIARELAGKVAGVIGLGDVGGRLATMLSGLGMSVLFVNRSRRDRAEAVQVELPDLLSRADLLFLTLPLTPQTFHLLDAEAFALMRPQARVVNVSSDELIDPGALAWALRSGRIAGAALDLIGSPEPYRALPNLILTPACAWYTEECVRRRADTWITTIERYAAGDPRHVVT